MKLLLTLATLATLATSTASAHHTGHRVRKPVRGTVGTRLYNLPNCNMGCNSFSNKPNCNSFSNNKYIVARIGCSNVLIRVK